MTATEPKPVPDADTWTAQLEQLRARYKHVREPILVALNILLHDQSISVEDAKAQAALHGVKITAASVAAAQRLLSRMDDKPAVTALPTTNGPPAGFVPLKRASTPRRSSGRWSGRSGTRATPRPSGCVRGSAGPSRFCRESRAPEPRFVGNW